MRIGLLVSLLVHGAGLAALVMLHGAPFDAGELRSPLVAFREQEPLPPEPPPEDPELPAVKAVAERWEIPEDPPDPEIEPRPDTEPVTGALRLPAPVRLAVTLRRAPAPAPEPPAAKPPAPPPPEAPLRPRAEAKLELPRLLEQDPAASVRYPDRARRLGLTGTVVLRLDIAADGTVAAVELDTSSGHEMLDRAAAEAASRWRFAPARRGGVPVAHEIRVPVSFGLTDA